MWKFYSLCISADHLILSIHIYAALLYVIKTSPKIHAQTLCPFVGCHVALGIPSYQVSGTIGGLYMYCLSLRGDFAWWFVKICIYTELNRPCDECKHPRHSLYIVKLSPEFIAGVRFIKKPTPHVIRDRLFLKFDLNKKNSDFHSLHVNLVFMGKIKQIYTGVIWYQ